MKAILEFNYPDDEDKLRHALHGGTAIFALEEVRQAIRAWEKHDGKDHSVLIERIKVVVAEALYECGEV